MVRRYGWLVYGWLLAVAGSALGQELAMSRGYVTPNAYTGTDSQRINAAVAAAAEQGLRVVIPHHNESAAGPSERWLLDEAILLPSNTVLELDNCTLKLSDRCRDNFIRSANCGLGITDIAPLENITIRGRGHVLLEGADHPRATGDSAKVLGERTYGTDAGKPDVSPNGDWRNIGILLAYVNGFRIENLHLKDYHCWAISLERCSAGVIRDLSFDARGSKLIDGERATILNQDGLDLRQGCHDILIDGLYGQTGDDVLALTAITRTATPAGSDRSTMVSGTATRPNGADDIRRITIRNVQANATIHHVVRFLNNRGLRMYDILLDGVVDTSPPDRPCRATVKIGDATPAYGGLTPFGDTAGFVVQNIISNSTHSILIAGSLVDSVITNVVRRLPTGDPITYESGPDAVRNLTISNLVQTPAER